MLQTGLGLSEPEAFRWIQKTAMDLRKSMREVAEGVIEHGGGSRRRGSGALCYNLGRVVPVVGVQRPKLGSQVLGSPGNVEASRAHGGPTCSVPRRD